MRRSEVFHVAEREIRTRARTRAFRGITALLAFLAIAAPIGAALLPSGDDEPRSVTVAFDPAFDADVSARFVDAAVGKFTLDLVDIDELDDVDAAVDAGSVDVAVISPGTLVWDEEIDFELAAVLEQTLQQATALERGRSAGLDDDEIAALLAPIELEQRLVDAGDATDDIRYAIAGIGLMVSFILPQVFGQLTLLSVVEEKSTRVVEVLLSHIAPRTLLLGKIIGLTILAMIQVTIVVSGLALSLLATDRADVPSSAWQFVPIMAASALGGLLLYNTLFALLGSLIARQEDAGQVMLPVFIPLMAGLVVGQIAVLDQADALLPRILTLVPFTTPMLLPVRVARGAIPAWEVALALALLAVTIWLLLRLAARLYRFTLLHTGTRIGWGRVWQLARGTPLQ